MSVRIVDNSNVVGHEFEKQVLIGAMAIGMKAEGYAKRQCPVDTGRLRNSITNEIADNAIHIGTNVQYAKYVEYMDKYGKKPRKTGQPHFLRDAATKHSKEYESIMRAALKGLGKTLN